MLKKILNFLFGSKIIKDDDILPLEEAWDKITNFYFSFKNKDGVNTDQNKAFVGEFPYMMKLLKTIGVKGKNVLDVGCGFGFYSFKLEKLKAKKVIAFDISSNMINLALNEKKKRKSKVKFSVGNAKKLEFPNKTFDIVVSAMVLHFRELDTAFAEFNRVLKNGGYVLFSVRHPLTTHGSYYKNNQMILKDYFTKKQYLAKWWTKEGQVSFKEAANTLEDYTETLFKNKFVITRIFESKPVKNLNKDIYKQMLSIPTYLIVLAKKTSD